MLKLTLAFLFFICLFVGPKDFERSRAFSFLSEVKKRFQTTYGSRAQTALPYAMNSEFSSTLAAQMVSMTRASLLLWSITNTNRFNNHKIRLDLPSVSFFFFTLLSLFLFIETSLRPKRVGSHHWDSNASGWPEGHYGPQHRWASHEFPHGTVMLTWPLVHIECKILLWLTVHVVKSGLLWMSDVFSLLDKSGVLWLWPLHCAVPVKH